MATGGHQSPPPHYTPPHRTPSHLEDKSQATNLYNQGENSHASLSITEADRDCWSPSQHHKPQHELVLNLSIPQNKNFDEPQGGGGARGRGSMRGRGRGRPVERGQGEGGRERVTGMGRGDQRGQVREDARRGVAVRSHDQGLEAPQEVNDPPGAHDDDDGSLGGDQREPPVHQHTCACFLVPACITAEQSRRRRCYGAYICWAFVSVLILMAALAVITVWMVEGQQKTSLSISSNETFKISDVFSNNHLFSSRLCLGPTTPPTPGTTMSYFLARTDCSEVDTENTREIIKGIYDLQKRTSKKRSVMFFWLNGTSFELQINIGAGNVTIYLLNEDADNGRCNGKETPVHPVVKKQCNATTVFNHTCYFSYTVNISGHYYLCFYDSDDTTTYPVITNYTLNIDLQYNELPHNTTKTTKCKWNSDCCRSYERLSDEIWQPTCIFVITNVTQEDDVGYCVKFPIKSFPRLELVWYSIGTLTVLLLLAAVCTAGYGSVVYKSRHPYTDVACTCHLYQRQHYEPVPPD